MNAAMDFLRQKGLATATKRSARQASEGVLELYTHGNGRVGVMVEVNCESDFVGRSDTFRELAHEIALQIAATNPDYITEADVPDSVIEHALTVTVTLFTGDGLAGTSAQQTINVTP